MGYADEKGLGGIMIWEVGQDSTDAETSLLAAIHEEVERIGNPDEEDEQDEVGKWIIGRAIVDGLPVIYKFFNEAPTDAKRKTLPWLTVISWNYDGSQSNGMPTKPVNDRMIALEDALEEGVVKHDFCEHVISKTGSNLKELIYYIHDRDKFMEKLNAALVGHDAYPIGIDFFNDPDWKEFQETRADFKKEEEQDVDQVDDSRESNAEGNKKNESEGRFQ